MLLGLGHQRGVGKGVAASYLCEHGFVKLAFADPLKEGARAVFGLSKQQCTDPVLKETVDPFWGVTPRFILQRFGTECLRKGFADDIWIRALKRQIDNMRNGGFAERGDFVIDDCRFLNEVAAVKSWGGFCVKISRPGLEPQRDTDGKIHPSETELLGYQGWDAHLVNQTTRLALGEKILALVADFRKGG
jgi:hypothetical protein